MLRFLFRRLLIAIPTLFVVVTLAFFMMRAAPGSPFVGERRLSPEVERNVMAKYGMDRPLPVQYVNYVGGVLHGDFGPSLKYKDKTVLRIIGDGFPKSLLIGSLAMALAAVVGVNILVTGGRLVAQSVRALLDQAISSTDLAAVVAALDPFRSDQVAIHGLQTRQSGRQRFVTLHVLVPGDWTVQRGHDLIEEIEVAVHTALPDCSVFTHLEPREDPRAYDDYAYDGQAAS